MKKILIIDDDASIGKIAKIALAEKNIVVDNIVHPHSLDMIRDIENYDAIFIDQIMPTIKGKDIAKKIVEKGFEKPIYITSNYSKDEVMKEFEGIPVTGFLDKNDIIKSLREIVPLV